MKWPRSGACHRFFVVYLLNAGTFPVAQITPDMVRVILIRFLLIIEINIQVNVYI